MATVGLLGCSAPNEGPAAESPTAPAGRLVIVGGALASENALVWQAVLDGRDGDGPICVIPTASGVPERSMASARDALNQYGGPDAAVGVLIVEGDTASVADLEVVAALEGCSGYWFTGGQQSRIVETFQSGGSPSAALEAVRRRFEEGAVVAGTSAGAAIMSERMIAGGSSVEALSSGLRASPDGDGVGVREGLGFFRVGVVDQHFLARGRIGRLIVAVLEDPQIDVGFGIDENTALVVYGDHARVVGASGVIVVDGRAGSPESIGLAMAGASDRIDLETLEVEYDPAKRPLAAGDEPFPEEDILGRWAFLNALAAFSKRLDVGMVADFNGRLVRLEKGDGFTAVVDSTGGEGPGGAPSGFGAGPFRMEIEPR